MTNISGGYSLPITEGEHPPAVNGNVKPTSIAIIGAGFSGTSTAIALLRQQLAAGERGDNPAYLELTIFEQEKRKFGAGLAYSKANGPEHFTNIPARLLSAIDEEPTHFSDWLKTVKDQGWKTTLGRPISHEYHGEFGPHNIVPRALYGIYLRDTLESLKNQAEQAGLAQVHSPIARITGIRPRDHQVRVDINQSSLTFDHAVLATGHIEFGQLPALTNLHHRISQKVVSNPRSLAGRTEAMLSGDFGPKVAVIGTGLSAYDHVLTALDKGFFDNPKAELTLVSRHGHTHPSMPIAPFNVPTIKIDDLPSPPPLARFVPAYVAQVYRQYRALGHKDWEITAGLQPLVPELVERSGIPKARLARMLRTHASKINTTAIGVGVETASKIEALIQQGRVKVVSGDIHRAKSSLWGRVRMDYTPTGSERVKSLYADAVISALGPLNNYRNTRHPIYRDMVASGDVSIHQDTNVGLAVDPDTRCLVDDDGDIHQRLHAVGPMTAGQVAAEEGRFGALGQNIPLLRRHALQVARSIIKPPTLVLTADQRVTGSDQTVVGRDRGADGGPTGLGGWAAQARRWLKQRRPQRDIPDTQPSVAPTRHSL
ncbi:MAG: FAD/NAD(P)-binding protein [Pseudomonadota bacterium]